LGLEDTEEMLDYKNKVMASMGAKQPGDCDDVDVQLAKALSRQVEAHQAAIKTGVKTENIYNINLPFYQTGTVGIFSRKTKFLGKKPVGEADMMIHKNLLNEIQPDHIFCAGDLTDPHGTHRKCLQALIMALKVLRTENCEWLKKCETWFYRGAWQEWEIERVDLAVTLTTEEVHRKR
jgi:glucosamine-6-phosphate deaminase